MAFHRVLLQRREISKYTAKKKSEGTGYQGHMHKKKLKTVLRERKHIYASKFACGLRVRKNPLAH